MIRRLKNPTTLATYAVLLVAAALTLGPVWWTFTTSLRPAAESFSLPPSFFPLDPDFSSYAAVFEQIRVPLLVLNSGLVTLLIAGGQMITAAMAGYVFARMEFRGKNALFAIVLSTMMVPAQVTIVPVFMLIRGMGLSDTLLALIIPAIPTAFGTFLMRQYFLGLPLELGRPPPSTVRAPGAPSSRSTRPWPCPAWRSWGCWPSTSTGTSSSGR